MSGLEKLERELEREAAEVLGRLSAARIPRDVLAHLHQTVAREAGRRRLPVLQAGFRRFARGLSAVAAALLIGMWAPWSIRANDPSQADSAAIADVDEWLDAAVQSGERFAMLYNPAWYDEQGAGEDDGDAVFDSFEDSFRMVDPGS